MTTSANTGQRGQARYLSGPPASAAQNHQAQRREAAQEAEKPAVVKSIGTPESDAYTAMLRDPVARKAHREAEQAARDKMTADREAAREERNRERPTPVEIADPSSRGMSRYWSDNE